MKSELFDIPKIDESYKLALKARVIESFEKSYRPAFSQHLQIFLPVIGSISLALIMVIQLQNQIVDSDASNTPHHQTLDKLAQDLHRIEHQLESDAQMDTFIVN